jgi:membrane protein
MADLWSLGGLSWRELLKRTIRESWDDEVFGQAARLAFYHLLALFPALLLTATILGRFSGAGADLLHTLQSSLSIILPERASETVTTFLGAKAQGAARHTVWFALLGSLWAALNGTWAVISGLNAAYEVEEKRPWWRVTLIGVGLTIALALLAFTALVLVFYSRRLGTDAWQIVHWLILAGMLLVAFALLYSFGPNVPNWQMRWTTPGAVIGVVLWLAASGVFRAYVGYEAAKYDQVYGSAGALAILLLWFYFTGAAILIGGEANSQIENAAAQHGRPDEARPGARRGEGTPGE